MPPSALGSQNGAVGRSGQDLPLLCVALGVLCWLCAPCRALGSPNFPPTAAFLPQGVRYASNGTKSAASHVLFLGQQVGLLDCVAFPSSAV